jgi:hypothetical protein
VACGVVVVVLYNIIVWVVFTCYISLSRRPVLPLCLFPCGSFITLLIDTVILLTWRRFQVSSQQDSVIRVDQQISRSANYRQQPKLSYCELCSPLSWLHERASVWLLLAIFR